MGWWDGWPLMAVRGKWARIWQRKKNRILLTIHIACSWRRNLLVTFDRIISFPGSAISKPALMNILVVHYSQVLVRHLHTILKSVAGRNKCVNKQPFSYPKFKRKSFFLSKITGIDFLPSDYELIYKSSGSSLPGTPPSSTPLPHQEPYPKPLDPMLAN